MSFCWTDFIDLATKIMQEKDYNEASCRTAISRYYYGCLNCVIEYILHIKLKTLKTDHIHSEVIKLLETAENADDYKLSQGLKSLKILRVKADYYNNEIINIMDAATAGELAKRIINILRNIQKQTERI